MQNQEIELRNIVAVLRRQSRIIAYAFAVIFGMAVVFLYAVTPTYRATALIIVDPFSKNLLESGAAVASGANTVNARIDSEVEIMRSTAVTLSVIAANNLISDAEFGPSISLREKIGQIVGIAHATNPVPELLVAQTLARFKNAIKIRRRGLTFLMSVSVDSNNPERAATLANSVSNTYIEQQVQAKVSASLAAGKLLQNRIIVARDTLSESEAAFDSFVTNNLTRIETAQGQDDISTLNSSLSRMELDARNQRKTRTEIERFLAARNWEKLTEALGDQALVQIESERRNLMESLSGRESSGEVITDLHTQLKHLEREMNSRSNALLTQMGTEITALEQSSDTLRAQIRSSLLSADLPTDLLTEIYAVQQEASVARTQYQNLLLRLRDIETQAHIQVADSRVVSPALAPINPSNPNRNLVLLVALAAALGTGISAAFLKEYYIGGVTSANQLSELFQTPTAATIPLTLERGRERLSVAQQVIDAPLSAYSESVRKLRAAVDQSFRAIQIAGEVRRGKTVLVTSALANEGKTTTALALARTYALAGKKALLIDADLRHPSVHRQLGFEPDIGFLDFLRDPKGANLGGAFYARDPSTSLALIMGAGRSDIPTDQLLNSTTFEALLDQARDVYDIIIIDSPPLLPVVDARYIAHNADAVVMAVRWAATSQSDLRAAVQPLRDAMRTGAALLPVLGQKEPRQIMSSDGSYYSGYSAAS